MKKNKNAFSLIIAMGLVLVSSLLAYTILEFIVPFSKDIKGIENSTMSYYMANTGIEEGLYFFSNRTGSLLRNEDSHTYTSNYDYSYKTTSSGNTLPPAGKGNSPFDKDWDTISVGNPVQLSIGYGFVSNVSTLNIDFRVPVINFITQTLSGTTTPMINWQLVSPYDTLNATTADIITASKVNGLSFTFSDLNGKKVSDSGPDTFSTFFGTNNCGNASVKCILKLSIINPLQFASSGGAIPFLEWQMNNGLNNIPLQYSVIESEGKSNGFVKKMQIKVPQETVPEAFDFTVFQ